MTFTGLKGKDVCDIIKSCKEAGVSELRLCDLHLIFGNTVSQIGKDEETPHGVIYTQNLEADKEAASSDLDDREDDLEELLLTDPERYEELQNRGELEDSDARRE